MHKAMRTVVDFLWRGAVPAVLLLILSVVGAHAGGFAIHEWSARGDGMAGALIARADDASALAYNPAGITQLKELEVIGGASFIAPDHKVTTRNPYTGESMGTRTESNIWMVPHFYAAAPVNDRWSAGVGVFTRFGLGTEYDDDWPGRYQTLTSIVKSVSLNPNVAFKVNDKFSVAAGVEAMWFTLDLKNAVDGNLFLAQQGVPVEVNNPDTFAMDVTAEHTGSSVGFGVNLALRYEINDTWAVGLAYRSQMEHEVNGEVDFNRSPAAIATFGDALFQDGDIKGSVVLPDWFGAGIAITPSEDLRFEFDVTYTRWSLYDALIIEYDNPQSLGIPEKVAERKWRDTWRFQIGGEYDYSDQVTLRAGYVFDQCPINDSLADYMVPANDYHYFHLGTGLHLDNITMNLAYTFLNSEERTLGLRLLDGVYDSFIDEAIAHIFSGSLVYRF